jgi:hypothetical protein
MASRLIYQRIEFKRVFVLVAMCFFAFSALQTMQIGSRAADREQEATRERCPPDGSQIALFTRQAFDQGREAEFREYAKFTTELAIISASEFTDKSVVEKSLIAAVNFAKGMRAQGHDIRVADLIIHREETLNSVLRNSKSLSRISKAQLELQLAVIQEMKRVMCR